MTGSADAGPLMSNAPSSARRTSRMSPMRCFGSFCRQRRRHGERGERPREQAPVRFELQHVRERQRYVLAGKRARGPSASRRAPRQTPRCRRACRRPAARLFGRHVGGRAENHPHGGHRRRRERRRVASALADPLDAPAGSSAFASPKSSTFTVPSGRTLMLAGFRSRWMMPARAPPRGPRRSVWRWGARPTVPSDRVRWGRQILALDQFHDQGRAVARLLESVDRRNVRMIQRGQHFRLALESGQPFRIGGHGRGQHLEGDAPFQLVVGRAIDLAHAAFAQFGHDLIGPDRPPDHGRGLRRATARPRQSSRSDAHASEGGPPAPTGARIS